MNPCNQADELMRIEMQLDKCRAIDAGANDPQVESGEPDFGTDSRQLWLLRSRPDQVRC